MQLKQLLIFLLRGSLFFILFVEFNMPAINFWN